MKKRIISILCIILSFCFIPFVKAAGSATISVTPSSSTVIVGNKVTLTVTISSSVPMAGLKYTIQYDSSILSLEGTTASPSGDGVTNLDFFMTDTYKKSYTYTFKARKSGSTNVSVVGIEVRDANNEIPTTAYSSRIRTMTQQELEATYSTNNNLSSLSIEGYELDPSFNKDQLEYNVTLKPETEVVKVIATKEDGTATIIGDGDIAVTEGLNVIKVEVTAQKGNIKEYIINATVEELNPINVNVGGIKYTVVRSKKNLDYNNKLFELTTTSIVGEEVPAYFNEITNTTLVALKNEAGEIKYFVEKDGEYSEFKEISLGNIDIMVLDTEDIPYMYKRSEFTINDIKYNGFRTNDISRYYLVYGLNLENNNKGFYSYDNYEGSIQRFDIDTLNMFRDIETKNMKLIYILGGTSILLFIILIIMIICRLTHNKKTLNKIEDIKNEINDNKVEPISDTKLEEELDLSFINKKDKKKKKELKEENKQEKKE